MPQSRDSTLHNSHRELVNGLQELCSPGPCPRVSVRETLHIEGLAGPLALSLVLEWSSSL